MVGKWAVSWTCSYCVHTVILGQPFFHRAGRRESGAALMDLLTRCLLHGRWPSPEVRTY